MISVNRLSFRIKKDAELRKQGWTEEQTSCPQGGSLTPNEADPTVGIYGWPLTLKVHVEFLKQSNA